MPLIKAEPYSKEWYDLRNKYIGASEVAALFDASPYLTKFELWVKKSGKLQEDSSDSERMFWGRTLEEAIAKGAADKNEWRIVKGTGYYVHDTVKGMGCTPDFFIYPATGTVGLMEVKNVDGLEYARNWINDEPPLNYLLQLQHQLACTNCTWGVIAALVGGNTLKVYRYDRHEGVISKIETAINEFWKSIAENIEPKAVADDYEIVRQIFQKAEEREIDLSTDNELPELCSKALEASKRRLDAEKEEKAAKAEIIKKVGSATLAKCSGFYIKHPEIVKNMPAKEAYSMKYRQLTIKEERVA